MIALSVARLLGAQAQANNNAATSASVSVKATSVETSN